MEDAEQELIASVNETLLGSGGSFDLGGLNWTAAAAAAACLRNDSSAAELLASEDINCTELLSRARAQEECRHPEYYSFNYVVVGTFFQSIIFLIGVLGNLLVCAVVYRTRSMHSTTNCYLVLYSYQQQLLEICAAQKFYIRERKY